MAARAVPQDHVSRLSPGAKCACFSIVAIVDASRVQSSGPVMAEREVVVGPGAKVRRDAGVFQEPGPETIIKIIGTMALAGILAACTFGPPANPTTGGLEAGSSGAIIGCLVTIPIGCAPGAVVGAVAGGTLGATGNALAVPPPPAAPPPRAAAAYQPGQQ